MLYVKMWPMLYYKTFWFKATVLSILINFVLVVIGSVFVFLWWCWKYFPN